MTDDQKRSQREDLLHPNEKRHASVSLVYPASPTGPGQLDSWADLVHDAGMHRLWLGQTTFAEPHQLFAALAGSGRSIPTGTSVTLAPLRHPWEAALQARSAALMSRRSHVLGIGSGHAGFGAALSGTPPTRPIAALREYVTIVNGLLRGEIVDFTGEFHSMHGALGSVPGEEPDVSVGIGVLRPAAARLAGEIANTAITWLAPPNYLRDRIIPAIREGEQRNPDSVSTRVVAVVHICIDRPGRNAIEWARSACGLHALLPHYTDMLRKSGVYVRDGDQDTNVRAIVDSGAFVYGSASEIAERLDSWYSAGVDEVVLNPGATLLRGGTRDAMRDCQEVVDAIRSRTRGVVNIS